MNLKKVYKVEDIEGALELLEEYRDRGRLIAGGTDLIIKLREKRLRPVVLIDISDISEMKKIEEINEILKIGAVTTFASISKAPLFQTNLRGLAEAARSVGSPQIRNAATIGGNICNASPAADIIPPLLALDAIITIKGKAEEAAMSLEAFLLDKGKVKLESNQMLYNIAFEKPNANQSLGFAKLGLRKALAISRIAVAVFLEIEENHFKQIRVATGACGKLALREGAIEDFLNNKAITDQTIEEASELFKTQIEARLQGRNAAEYKAVAIKGVFIEALNKALSYQNK